MKDGLEKHLELIQGVINRLAGNSFMIKGWSVTLIAALFALAASGADETLAWVSLVPAVFFWGLDGFFLAEERRFRNLYDTVRKKHVEPDGVDFAMFDGVPRVAKATWRHAAFSRTLLAFHLPLVVVTAGVACHFLMK